MQLLKNKVIFITGGTAGIGFECAKAYYAAGAKLSIIAHCEKSIQQAEREFSSDGILYIKADVSSSAEVQQAIEDTIKHYGQINAVHNNAGISDPSKTLHETTDEEWHRLFDVNVKGIFNTTRFAIAELKRNKGSIV
ncbi:MAG: SDR family NAD(P)-dependent oxidoreductase, partial [Sphingobacteriaceae bacterium]